jgi:hypothetical protein
MPSRDIEAFIARWSAASSSERANAQLFLVELCDLLSVPRPDPKPDSGYAFEFPVTEHHPDGSTSLGRIDLYKRAAFLLEAKQFQDQPAEPTDLQLALVSAGAVARKRKSAPVRGTGAWDDAMLKARGQAERYVRALPPTDPNPPFMLVVDVGNSIEVFANYGWTATLAAVKQAVSAAEVAKAFARVKAGDGGEILETLCTMGHARRGKVDGTFVP